jgi:uncharacterized protein (TIGR02271 family)
MNYEKIVTLYDTAEHAETARRNLENAGFSTRDISLVSNKTLGRGERLLDLDLWHRLFGRDVEKHEAAVYGRTVDSGGVILTVRVPETEAAKATAILNAHHAVDVRDRAVREGLIKEEAMPAAGQQQPATMAAGGTIVGEEVLSLAEEQLDVGKRMVQEGTTRIRRFVTETPVETQVTLHEEHIRVIRRTSSDPNFAKNVDWTEKTVEAIDTMEEPVITKSAHVAEEVVIRKEGIDRVQTVRDKIRRQDVKVETSRGAEDIAKKA